jgi:hypothetical protein
VLLLELLLQMPFILHCCIAAVVQQLLCPQLPLALVVQDAAAFLLSPHIPAATLVAVAALATRAA